MILDRTFLDLNEVQDILKDLPDNEKKGDISLFLKKFIKSGPEKVKKIKQNLEKLDMLKLKGEYMVKIIDLLPEDASDLNKIFIDVSLNEDETNKILEIIRDSK